MASAGCREDEFDCYNTGHKCIPKSFVCDYDDDCGNKADERNCPEKCTAELYTPWVWAQEEYRRRLATKETGGATDYGGKSDLV